MHFVPIFSLIMVTSTPKPKTHSVSFAPPNAPQAQATSAKPVQSCPTGTPDTPFRPGTSNKMTGFDNLSSAKTALKDEMAGAILPFPNKSTVNNLLKKAAKASDVESFLHSSKHFSQVAGDWKDIRMAVDDEKKLYPKLLPIFEEILAFFHNTSNRSVFHLKQGKLVKMEDGDELKTAPDFFVTGAGRQFRRQDQAVAWRSCASFIDAKRHDKIPKSNSMNQAWEMQFCSYARYVSFPVMCFGLSLLIDPLDNVLSPIQPVFLFMGSALPRDRFASIDMTVVVLSTRTGSTTAVRARANWSRH